jgi:hypothetical protein
VAFFAIDDFVFSFEFEAGNAVVERRTCFDFMERLDRMAGFTIHTKLSFVGIYVAGITIFEWYIGKMLEGFSIRGFDLVAQFAIHIFMSSGQRKSGFIMIKKRCRFECFIIMTFFTIRIQSFFVVVVMTGNTAWVQP